MANGFNMHGGRQGGGGRPLNGPQGRGGGNTPIPSPYNFVPLADKVFFPDWAGQVSMDAPFSDGISGHFDIKVTAKTPVYIRSGGVHPEKHEDRLKDAGYKSFFRTPDGKYAIPGTSLKGMLRAVVEIASFGKIIGGKSAPRVDDHRYAMRDLNNNSYREQFTENMDPKVKAAWLSADENGDWQLALCDFARPEQEDLERHFGLEKFSLGKRDPSSPQDKYQAISRENGSLEALKFDRGPRDGLGRNPAVNLGKGKLEGTLVLTGQPMPRDPNKTRRKHMEFVFYGKERESVPVSPQLKEEFQFVHSELGQNRKFNPQWTYWKSKLDAGKRVPVFVLLDGQEKISSMGLAMMYRLPYKYSIHEMIGHSLEEHKNAERLDLAELIFGRVEDKDALRGRVCVETLAAEGDPKPMTEVKTVLSGPKPTYYPNYVEQDAGPDGALRGEYKTFMHDDAKIRGWKRYIVRKDSEDIPRFDTSPTESVATAFNPLPAGTSFTGRVHIHNMRPQELGALVWAMTWGGDNNLRHSLGMGKPYGFGSVTVEISGYSLAWCDPLKRDDIDTEGMGKEFEALMQKAVPCWPDSPQIKALKAMANPETHWPQELRYPRLDNNGNNEFATFKGAGLAPKRVLVHPPGGSVPAPAVAPGQKFSAGQKVRVKSVEDPRGKGRPWFEAPDGDQGTVVGGNAPVVAIGEYCELEIASCNSPKGYNFRVPRR